MPCTFLLFGVLGQFGRRQGPHWPLRNPFPIEAPRNVALRGARRLDCSVQQWGAWSACRVSDIWGGSRRRGALQTRTRSVLSRVQFGGQACPATLERKCCTPGHCGQQRALQATDEAKALNEAFLVLGHKYDVRKIDTAWTPYHLTRSN